MSPRSLEQSKPERLVHPALLEIRQFGRPSKFSRCGSCRSLGCCSSERNSVAALRYDVIVEGLPTAVQYVETLAVGADQIPFYDPSPMDPQEEEKLQGQLLEPCSPQAQDPLAALQCCNHRLIGQKLRSHAFTNVPDHPDPRDHLARFDVGSLPSKVDLRLQQQRRAMHQHGEGSNCVAGAIVAALHFDTRKMSRELWAHFVPSLRFINYNLRFSEAGPAAPSVTSLRDGIKSVKHWGICPESRWPYDESKLEERPPPMCYQLARKFELIGYKSVQQTLPQLKGCLATGQPFVFGFIVHDSFNSGAVELRGKMSMPWDDDDPIQGGHAVCAIGYCDARRVFTVSNSWGCEWGDGGCFYMPYEYITDPKLAYDFWTINWVGGGRGTGSTGCPAM